MDDVNNYNDDPTKPEGAAVYYPGRNELWQIIETIQKLSLFPKDDAIVQSYANHVACIIDQHFMEKTRQATIRGYFQSL